MTSASFVRMFIYVFIIGVSECYALPGGDRATPATLKVDGESGETKVLLRRAFSQLLRLKSLPNERNGDARSATDSFIAPSVASPPRYMLELYERYRRGYPGNRGNTVRSILALRGDINGDQMLLFNLSGINWAEEVVLHGELHFNKRKKVKWPDRSLNAPGYRMKFYSISSKEVDVTPLDVLNITSRTPGRGRHGGWQVLDVTRQVSDCRKHTQDHNSNHLLAIKLQGLNRRSKFVDISLKTLIRLDNTPFLIIFSNDKDNGTGVVEGWDETIGLINTKPKILDDKDDDIEEQETKIKNENELDVNNGIGTLKRYSRAVADRNQTNYGFKHGTLMSWIDNNEYPENSVLPDHELIPKTGPEILNPRKRSRVGANNQTIPYPKVGGGPFGHKRRMKKKENASLPASWLDKIRVEEENGRRVITGFKAKGNNVKVKMVPSAKETDKLGCRRKRLHVDFADLYWADRIIAPASFEAYYCSGQCRFPTVKEFNPSNHALIQSLVNAIGLDPDVPSPCCVADSTSSLSLLYFDGGNVVLKNYPGMIVESCACR